jgi:hypothetical protein
MAKFLDEKGEPIGPPLPDHISLDVSEMASPWKNVPKHDRLAALAEVSAAARADLKSSLASLQSLLRCCDPIALLAHFAFYDLTFPYSEDSPYTPAQQHQVEIIQSLILMVPEDELTRVPPTPDQRLTANKLSEQVAHAFMMHRFDPGKLSPIDQVREQVRSATQVIRNPGDSDQVLNGLVDLFAPLDRDLLAHRGVTFTGLIRLCQAYTGRVEDRYNSMQHAFKRINQQPSVEGMLVEFEREFPFGADVTDRIRSEIRAQNLDRRQVLAGMWSYSEFLHSLVFAADLDELLADYPEVVERQTLQAAVDSWSFEFGALQGHTTEFLFLDNPLWRRPLLKIGRETYFWPIAGSFVSFGMEMLEAQFAGNTKLKEKYHARRAEFLEDRVATLVAEAIPTAAIYRNLIWFDPKEGETDILVLVDKHALVIECKSGRVKPSAKRGGARLSEDIKDLIQDPTEQGCRFATLLRASKEPLLTRDRSGRTYEIFRSKIRRVTRVNVLLDFFGALASEYRLLSAAGLLATASEPAVTMSLVDLENVTWILESPSQFLHYLHRRIQLERRAEVIADEMDWLACYLGGILHQPLFGGDLKLNLLMCSASLEPYLFRRSLKLAKKVPKLRLSPWWQKILTRLEEVKCEGWTEMGLILLSFSYEEQNEYREYVELVAAQLREDPQLVVGREMVYAHRVQGDEHIAVGTLVFAPTTREDLDRRMANAIDALHEQGADRSRLLLMLPVTQMDAPYFRIVIEEPLPE